MNQSPTQIPIHIPRGKAKFIMGISDPLQLDEWLKTHSHIIGVAFIGRSNVGKSSLINSIFGKSTARVSKTPGRTREINIFEFELAGSGELNLPKYYAFDLPGYGHAEVSKAMSKNWNTLMDLFFNFASLNIALVNIQDARLPDQGTDQTFYQFLKGFNFDSILVLNKLDKLKTQKERHELKKTMPPLFKKYKFVKQIFYISAEKMTGVKELHDTLVNFLLKKTSINYN